ncbi:MAG TPA: winged-helix domain-containing protein [Coriobacteriia bacterium]|nr:winged-helix domain-containing protein [Coriobacteriia bacterium]
MTGKPKASDATIYRLSLYHCYLGNLNRAEGPQLITSGRLARELDVSEETVRRDLSCLGSIGRPGAGYRSESLLSAIQDYLGLTDDYPIVQVGSAQMLEALSVVFPPEDYGVRPVALFSELVEDAGKTVHGIVVRHIDELPSLDRGLGACTALVACSPAVVHGVLDALDAAGVTAVMLLTPAVTLDPPQDMLVTQVRIPCDIKSLACRVHMAGSQG